MATNPYRGLNRTDFHMCGGCGRLLYLSGERRIRRTVVLLIPVLLGVTFFAAAMVSRIEGLNIVNDGRQGPEPNLLGGLVILFAFIAGGSALLRYEAVGVASLSESTDEGD